MKYLALALTLLLPFGLLPACDNDAGKAELGETDTRGPSSNDESGDDSGGPQQPGDDGASGEEPTDDGPPPPITFDLGTVPDAPGNQKGCRAVDFLFVIDNSGSMSTSQQNLTDNFPTFIEGIQSTLTEVESYQVGVVTTDAYGDNVNACDELGGLVVQTGGRDSSEEVCGPYAEGGNFMTEMDDLTTTFECAAQVGTDGDNYELTMEAMERAIDGTHAGPGQCNENFVRDNALLVVVLITDEADGPGDTDFGTSAGDPGTWYQTVVASKGDKPENAAILSLLDPISGQNIADFTEMFGDNGFVGDIYESDYGPSFQQAIGVVESACENFVPPG